MVAQVLKHQWVTTLVPLRKGAKPAEIFGLIFLVLVSLFLSLIHISEPTRPY